MKKRTVVLFLFIALLFSTLSGAAVALSQDNMVLQASASTTLSEGENIKHIDVRKAPNIPSNLYVDGEDAISIDFDVNSINAENETLPRNIDSFGVFDNNQMVDLWETVEWLRIQNDTEFNGKNFNVSAELSVNHVGSLSKNSKSNFELSTCPDIWNEITLDLDEGVYLLFSYQGNLGARLVSENGLEVQLETLGNDFASDIQVDLIVIKDEGIYNLYMQTLGCRQINLLLKDYSSKSVDETDYVEHQDSEIARKIAIDGCNPADMPVYVYDFEALVGKSVKIDLIDNFGTLNAFVAYKENGVMKIDTLTSLGNVPNYLAPRNSDEKIYLIMINVNFWRYDNVNTNYESFLWYDFSISLEDTVSLETEDFKTLYLQPYERKFIKLNVNETIGMLMNWTFTSGMSAFNGMLMKWDEVNEQYMTESHLIEAPGGVDPNYHIYLLKEGVYYFSITTQNTGCDLQTVKIQTRDVLANTDDVAAWSDSATTSALTKEDMSLLSFNHFYTNDGGNFMPKIVPFDFTSGQFNFAYNISMFRSDNSFIGSNETRMGLRIVVLEESRYNNKFTGPAIFDNNVGINQFSLDFENIGNQTSYLSPTTEFIEGGSKGYIVIQPRLFWIDGPSDSIRHNGSVNLRFATLDDIGLSNEVNYGDVEQGYIDLANVDFDAAPFNTTNYYAQSYSVNATLHNRLIISFNGSQEVDWYRLILRTNNTDTNTLRVRLYDENNVWKDNTGPNTPYKIDDYSPFFSSSNFNLTSEMGFVSQQGKIIIDVFAANSDFPVQFWITVVSEGVSSLNAEATGEYTPGFNWLALGLSLGIGIPVLAGGGYFFWKKKKGGV